MDFESEQFRVDTMKLLFMQLNSINVMDVIVFGGSAIGIIMALLDFKSGKIDFKYCLFICMTSIEFFVPFKRCGSFFHVAMSGNAA